MTLVWALAPFGLFRQARGARLAQAGVAVIAIVVGVLPAWPRLSPWSVSEPGLCRAISPNRMWPYLSDWAVADEPSEVPRVLRVGSPSIALTEQASEIVSGALSSVAVTFSGHFEPRLPGWYIFRIETIGQAALYIDGFQRLKIEGPGEFQETKASRVFLEREPHELVVRYMSDKPVRRLSVSVGLKDGPLTPLQTGLSSRACR